MIGHFTGKGQIHFWRTSKDGQIRFQHGKEAQGWTGQKNLLFGMEKIFNKQKYGKTEWLRVGKYSSIMFQLLRKLKTDPEGPSSPTQGEKTDNNEAKLSHHVCDRAQQHREHHGDQAWLPGWSACRLPMATGCQGSPGWYRDAMKGTGWEEQSLKDNLKWCVPDTKHRLCNVQSSWLYIISFELHNDRHESCY